MRPLFRTLDVTVSNLIGTRFVHQTKWHSLSWKHYLCAFIWLYMYDMRDITNYYRLSMNTMSLIFQLLQTVIGLRIFFSLLHQNAVRQAILPMTKNHYRSASDWSRHEFAYARISLLCVLRGFSCAWFQIATAYHFSHKGKNDSISGVLFHFWMCWIV